MKLPNLFLTFCDSPELAVAKRGLSRRKSKETSGGSMENEKKKRAEQGWIQQDARFQRFGEGKEVNGGI